MDDKRGLGAFDRIALRVVGILTISITGGIFTLVLSMSTTLAIVENKVENIIATANDDIKDLKTQMRDLKNDIALKTQQRYTIKDAEKDSQVINFRLKNIENKLESLELK